MGMKIEAVTSIVELKINLGLQKAAFLGRSRPSNEKIANDFRGAKLHKNPPVLHHPKVKGGKVRGFAF